MNVCAITPDNLERLGYREVKAGVWARLRLKGRTFCGSAVVFRPDGCFTVSASMNVEKMKGTFLRICNAIAEGRMRSDQAAQEKKQKAETLLSALMLKQLEPPEVGARDESDVEFIVGEIVGSRRRRRDRRARRRKRRAARRERFRKALNRMSKKLAKNKVMVKLRKGWAKVIKGPIGKGAAKLVANVLQVFGVPRKATETAIKAHHNRVASRLEEGGWAGVVERASRHKGAWKGALKKEAKRFAKGYKDAAKDTFRIGEELPGGRTYGGGFVQGPATEVETARALMHAAFAPSTPAKTLYALGSGY